MPGRRECANAIRALSIDAIEKAASGHPGAPLGMADMAEALWRHVIKHNPADPAWPDRDRFILSNGHASMLLYSLLHLTGYDLSMDDLRAFRQWQSKTPGHPEYNPCIGVEMTTGPLGQGLASAVGMALAEAMLAAEFNRPGLTIVDHYTWVFCGEGCLMEGVSHEACSLAGVWRLGKLIVLFDSNDVSIDGNVQAWFGEDPAKRFEAYGWQVIGPVDGHAAQELDTALKAAKADRERPTLIICKTHIGFGSPRRDSAASHGAPLGSEAAQATKEALGWSQPPFAIPAEIYAAWDARQKGAELEAAWQETFAAYAQAWPLQAEEFKRRLHGELPPDWPELKSAMLAKMQSAGKKMATRVASRDCLELLVPGIPGLVGGSADLSGSNGTITGASVPLEPATHCGNYLHYGVREFAMGAIMNGLALHGGFIPYGGTFLAFSDQAKNALRMSGLMGVRVIWVFTHDSIGVGEDGPTHQPVEQVPALRLLPNMDVWRPCDNLETAVAWASALENARRPTSLVLSRQGLPPLERGAAAVADIARGGYVLYEHGPEPEIILLASGSEVQLALAAAQELARENIPCRVVSMPCCEIFDRQDAAWKEKVLPCAVECRLAIEAASAEWWRRYVGIAGGVVGMENFGASAPGNELFERFGFTVDNVACRARELVAQQKSRRKA
ncbi:MAG: transketolase [Desulfovibrio sp.]|nr:transketolase [Desulfovibrio sp.]